MVRRNTGVTIELPDYRAVPCVTEAYAKWWIASCFTILQFIHHSQEKRKPQKPFQSSKPKKKAKRTSPLKFHPLKSHFPEPDFITPNTVDSSFVSLVSPPVSLVLKPSHYPKYPSNITFSIFLKRCV